ncbi:MAG: hypothetical protein IKJ11_03055 [Clostridia bacterium]|nr:hypothetical protein [Clostridia bacterium]
MEMSSGCVRQDESIVIRRPVRGPHGGWQQSEIDALKTRIGEAEKTGESLRSVFDRLAMELGRKPNSIRNFYYAQMRAQSGEGMGRALPFETFAPGEVEQLVRSVLISRAQGMSVRACVRKLAGGDQTRMLRYQNKYRSTVRTRPELVRKVMDELTLEGVPFVSPFGADAAQQEETLQRMQHRAEQSGDAQLTQLFSSLDHLLSLALAQREPVAGSSDAQRRADRLSAQCDMLRISLDDEQTRREALAHETEAMVTLVKEYIALPASSRTAHTELFCRQAAERLSAVECALMPQSP